MFVSIHAYTDLYAEMDGFFPAAPLTELRDPLTYFLSQWENFSTLSASLFDPYGTVSTLDSLVLENRNYESLQKAREPIRSQV